MHGTMPDLDPATHAQVSELLGADRAAELLGLLAASLARLDGMSGDDLTGPEGLAAVHRLKSEAGMMGFGRLSAACQVFDAAGSRGAVPSEDLARLREAVSSALETIDAMSGSQASPRP